MKLKATGEVAILVWLLSFAARGAAQLADPPPPQRVPLGNVVMVVDDATGAPVRHYLLFDGPQFNPAGPAEFSKGLRYSVDSPDGSFVRRGSYTGQAIVGLAVRVIAEGYLPAESPVIGIGEYKPYVLRLKLAKAIVGTLLAPGGEPLADAQVAWVSSDRRAFIEAAGRMSSFYLASPEVIATSGPVGQFRLPPGLAAGAVVAVHEKGYAQVDTHQFSSGDAIKLSPWARVEGHLSRGSLSPANVQMRLAPAGEKPQASGAIYWLLNSKTSVDGSFVFDHVPSIPLAVGIYSMCGLSSRVLIDPKPGELTSVRVGGGGRDISGVMSFPAEMGADTARTAFEVGAFQSVITLRPASDASHDLQKLRELADSSRLMYAGDSTDGQRFTVPELPPGKYVLYVDVMSHPRGRDARSVFVAHASLPVEVGVGTGTVEVGEVRLTTDPHATTRQ